MNNDNHYYMSQNDICMFNMCPDFCPARPAGMSCYTGFSRTSRTKIRTNRTPGNPEQRTAGVYTVSQAVFTLYPPSR